MRAVFLGKKFHLVQSSYLGLTACGRDIPKGRIFEVGDEYFQHPYRCRRCVEAVFAGRVNELAAHYGVNTCVLVEG